MLLISAEQVRELLDPAELIGVMEAALKAFSAGKVVQPVRTAIPIAQYQAWFGLMPAVYEDVVGAKLVTVYPGNEALGLPTHMALIHLFRTATGEPLAVMDGAVITAMRTAAVSAIATRELAAPDAQTLAILGSGVQARSHFRLLSSVRTFREVRVWSRTARNAERFASGIGAGCAKSAEEAVRDADVIVAATHASEPVLHGKWLKAGAHVNTVGAVGAHMREVDDETMTNSAVVVESREAALRESGELMHSGAPIYAEIGELLAGLKPKPESRTTVYKSLGIAVEDVAAAKYIYAKALGGRAAAQL